MLDSIAFPLDLPAATKTDEAVVEFTIGADGSIGEATAACANYPAVLQGLDVPRNLVRSGVRRGDLVLEFMLQPSGRATDFVVLRTSRRVRGRSDSRPRRSPVHAIRAASAGPGSVELPGRLPVTELRPSGDVAGGDRAA
jgi:hypothetical protein